MDLVRMLQALHRWLWLIIAVMFLTALGVALFLIFAGPTYESRVRVGLTAVKEDDLDLFLEVLSSQHVRQETTARLGLAGDDAMYQLAVERGHSPTFVEITIGAPSPSAAADIATTHVEVTTAAFGELRARSLEANLGALSELLRTAEGEIVAAQNALAEFQAENGIGTLKERRLSAEEELQRLERERDQRLLGQNPNGVDPIAEIEALIAQRQAEQERLLALGPDHLLLEERVSSSREDYQQLAKQARQGSADLTQELQAAEENLRTAEEALADFQAQNGFVSLDKELATYQKLLEQLLVQRDELAAAAIVSSADSVEEVDELIAERRKEIDHLTALEPAYNGLQDKVGQAQTAFTRLYRDYTDARLVAAEARTGSAVHVVDPAHGSSMPVSTPAKQLPIALAAGLCLGVLLAFTLEFVSTSLIPAAAEARADQAAPADQQTASWGDEGGR